MNCGPKGVKRGGDQHDILRWFVHDNKKGAVSLLEVAPFKVPSIVKLSVPRLVGRGFLAQDPVSRRLTLTELGRWAVAVHDEPDHRKREAVFRARPSGSWSPAGPDRPEPGS